MTVIRPNSISGITSITAQSGSLEFYDATGSTLNVTGDVTGNVTGNVTGDINAGIITATSIVGVTTAGITTAYIGSVNDGPLSGARNRIINGDMRIAQRGTSAVTGAGYPVDRWIQGFTTSGDVSAQYETASTPTGFQAAIKFTTTTADATTDATDQWNVQQSIEGFNSADLLFGTANAQDVTVSFWVRSSVTGTFCVVLLGSSDGTTLDRSYVSEYTISSVDTWEKKTITVPGDTGGTWTTNNGRGLVVRFGLTAGTNFQQAAGSWSTGNVIGSSNQTQLLETLNATWYITGVQLEAGTVATPFERRSYGQELALCQRYYIKSLTNEYYQFPTNSGAQVQRQKITFPVYMRTSPNVARTRISGSAGTTVGADGSNIDGMRCSFGGLANEIIEYSWTSEAEL
jgi:hypothetical protein